MKASELTAKQWYWIRRNDGSLAPYLFHRVRDGGQRDTEAIAEFFVGSFLQTFRLNQIVAAAQMPQSAAAR